MLHEIKSFRVNLALTCHDNADIPLGERSDALGEKRILCFWSAGCSGRATSYGLHLFAML